ncbi:hypothetical protein VTN31DRAFT_5258 [Thermomyces dupontii]|uniref:uncharacterized protein n=1 Tax=Talaromyces thermophilus TaxID=28565 RepID=UPI0037438F05
MTESLVPDGGLGPPSPETRPREVSTSEELVSDQHDWSQWMRWDWDDHVVAPDSTDSPFASGSTLKTDDLSLKLSPPDDPPAISPSVDPFMLQPDGQPSTTSPNGNMPRLPLNHPVRHCQSGRKRKEPSDDDGSAGADDDSPPESKSNSSKRRSHNVIEKRYRANLNEKIAELRDSVPSLRALARQTGGCSGQDGAPTSVANKLNKASILSKATEYIRHLEIRNRRLEEENQALRAKLRELDRVIDRTVTGSVASASSPDSYTGTLDSSTGYSPSIFSHPDSPVTTRSSESSGSAEGKVPVPEYIKKMRASAAPGAFAESYIKDDDNSSRGMTRGSKFLLGTIAGLMVLQNINTNKDAESDEKGLMAVPISVLNEVLLPSIRRFKTAPLLWSSHVGCAWRPWFTAVLSHALVILVLSFICAFVAFLYLFYSRPKLDRDPPKVASGRLTPAELRRQAWLTSMQRVGVPQHHFFSEWFAVTSRWVEYTLGCLLGWSLYSWVTGITEDDEKGRVKTWDIAIDAQLAGGDAEISKSRLVLTIFAAGTLPRKPARTMLKALHCRILLWRVGEADSFITKISNDIARYLATYQWNTARELNRSLPKDHEDALPSHLAALVEYDCNDVFSDAIVQRATNLTWNRPTQDEVADDEALLDVVVDDPGVQTSLDTVAAWWSSHLLQNALLQSFKSGPGAASRDALKAQFDQAIAVAPRPSAAHTRALVMKAVLFEEDKVQNINAVLAALPAKEDKQSSYQASNFLDSSLPVAVREEISIAVRCAMIAAIIRARAMDDPTIPAHFTVRKAINWFNQLPLDPLELTLVGFAAVYHLLHIVTSYNDLLSSPSCTSASSSASSDTGSVDKCTQARPDFDPPQSSSNPRKTRHRTRSEGAEPTPQYRRVASELVYWARHAYNPALYGFTPKMADAVEEACDSMCKNADDMVSHTKGAHEATAAEQHAQKVESSLRKIMNIERKKRAQRNSSQDSNGLAGQDEKNWDEAQEPRSLESHDRP